MFYHGWCSLGKQEPSSFLSFGSFLGRTLFLSFPMCYVNTAVKAEGRHRLKPLKLGGKKKKKPNL